MTAESAGTDRDQPLSVPFVVGATGHRDLDPDDEEDTRAHVRAELEALAGFLPHSPLRLLSSFAEGADRLVVDEALSIGSLRIDVVAVLPMPLEAYATDFDTDARVELNALLERSHSQVVVPPVSGGEWTEVSIRSLNGSSELRDAQYLAAGAWIVRHASLLIAVWDGKPARGPGGTAQIVDAMRLGLSIDGTDVSLDPADVGSVIHIWTRRMGDSTSAPRNRVQRLLPELLLDTEQRSTDLSSHQSRLGIFQRVGGPLLDEANECLACLPGPPHAGTRVDAGNVHTPYDVAYDAFDQLANQTRDIRALRLRRVVLLGLSTIMSLALYDFVLSRESARGSWLSVLPFLLALALAALAFRNFRLALYQKTDVRHTDYRALAECLRVQRSWWMAGLPHRVADNYLLRQQPTETLWLRLALRSIDVGAASQPLPAGNLPAACREWMTEQHLFFVRKSAEARRKQATARRRTRMLVRTGLAALVLVVCIHVALLNDPDTKVFDILGLDFGVDVDALMLLAAGLTAGAAATSKLLDRSSVEHNVHYYAWGELRFRHARSRLEALIDEGADLRARALMLQLGRLSLEENALWLIAQRERPIEAPEVV